MAVRELHVIDVGDTDPDGKPQQSPWSRFAHRRKSLTFYAFDLNEDRVVKAKRNFQVWAVPEAGKNAARSLGFLPLDAMLKGVGC
jgi:hypothetical protein